MPRPSDLYATLGAPGVYQSTPCTPRILPNVFVIPPAEDNQEIHCLFRSGSASPSTYETFYRGNNYAQRDPSSPTVTNMVVLDQALSFIQHQASAGIGAVLGGWDHGERIIPRNSGSAVSPGARPTVFPNLSFVVNQEAHSHSHENQIPPSRPTSRRSSVFGERPSDHEMFHEVTSTEEERRTARTKKSQTTTLRSRAAMALKVISGTKTRRMESDVHSEAGIDAAHNQSFFRLEQGAMPTENPKQAKRRTLAKVFGSSSSSSVNVSLPSPEPTLASPSPVIHFPPPNLSASNPKLTKRKSMTQLFGFARSSVVDTSKGHDAPAPWDVAPSPPAGPSLASPEPKLSKRKSMTQLLGIGRTSSIQALATINSGTNGVIDDMHMVAAEARLEALQALEGRVAPTPAHATKTVKSTLRRSVTAPSVAVLARHSNTQTSPASDKTPTRHEARKSLLRARAFSFLDLHRHFSSQPAPTDQSRIQVTGLSTGSRTSSITESPNPSSEMVDSSASNPASTDSEPETEDIERMFVSRPAMCSPGIPGFTAGRNSAVDLSSGIELDGEEKDDVPPWYDLNEAGDVDFESDEAPPLELVTRLNSLSFDQLSFDPDLFASTMQA